MPDPLLRPLCIGDLVLENNLLQAPLAGYSSVPFRLLAWELGRPGLLATEMISARALALKAPRQERYLAKAEGEGPVTFQIWGRDPDDIGEATRIVTDRGADVVDLNCGCPVRKVRAAGAGAKLMEAPGRIGRLVAAMRRSTDRPVSIKIRVGPDACVRNGVEVARVAADKGADLVTVHGRHGGERYSQACRLDEIAAVVHALSIPVVGNGDVRDGESARAMLETTGCAGVMIGRACMGAPWVFRQIAAALQGHAYEPPTRAFIAETLLRHHDRLADLVGQELAVRHCRKLGCYYAKGMAGAKEFRHQLNFCHSREALASLLQRVFHVEPALRMK